MSAIAVKTKISNKIILDQNASPHCSGKLQQKLQLKKETQRRIDLHISTFYCSGFQFAEFDLWVGTEDWDKDGGARKSLKMFESKWAADEDIEGDMVKNNEWMDRSQQTKTKWMGKICKKCRQFYYLHIYDAIHPPPPPKPADINDGQI